MRLLTHCNPDVLSPTTSMIETLRQLLTPENRCTRLDFPSGHHTAELH